MFSISNALLTQTTIDWVTLSDVTFVQKFDTEVGLGYDEATFGSTVSAFDQQEIKISGYIIPLDALGISYALSRNPNSSCFFCGGAGPETVIELKVKPSAMKRHKMDDIKTCLLYTSPSPRDS